uniref:Putative secreted protein n=1 Tax=Amblyomma triste TaxID=251400 RepID=A0A023G6W0_AMBTT
MRGTVLVVCLFLAASSGTGAWPGQSQANYFLDEELLNYPNDWVPMPDFGLDVDILVDDFLDYVQFEFSNGTANRFQRRVQRQGDCHNPYGQRVSCPISFVGLTVRYGFVKATRSSGDKITTADLFVNAGSATVEISFPRGGKSKLETFTMNSLKMTMRLPSQVLITEEVDKVFVQKTTENCERLLWRILQTDYARTLASRIANKPSIGI